MNTLPVDQGVFRRLHGAKARVWMRALLVLLMAWLLAPRLLVPPAYGQAAEGTPMPDASTPAPSTDTPTPTTVVVEGSGAQGLPVTWVVGCRDSQLGVLRLTSGDLLTGGLLLMIPKYLMVNMGDCTVEPPAALLTDKVAWFVYSPTPATIAELLGNAAP